MNTTQLTESIHKAREFHSRLNADDGIIPSFDAVFIAICVCGSPRPRSSKLSDEAVPEWLTDSIKNLKGRRLTIGMLMMIAGHIPASKAQKDQVGRWLRQLGHIPRKVGGEQLFTL